MTLIDYKDKATGKLFQFRGYENDPYNANLYVVSIQMQEVACIRGCYLLCQNNTKDFMENLNPANKQATWRFASNDMQECVEVNRIGLMFLYCIICAINNKVPVSLEN